MMSRVVEGKNSKQRVAAVARSAEVAARRPILVGILLTVALFTMFAIESRPSGAATTAKATKPSVTTPDVSPVTVTVPGRSSPAPPVTAPPVTTPTPAPAAPPAKVRTVVTPPVTSTPSSSTPAAPSARTPPASAGSSPATTSVASIGSSAPHRARAPRGGGSALRLRSVVVRLSSCVSRLKPRGQRLLLLRAGIGIAGPAGRHDVARKLRISVAREARSERAALRKLRRAARRGSCGSTPAWIHVPAANRLVLVDPALTVSQPAVSNQRTKVSLTPSAANTGSRLISGLEWGRLVWMPAQQS
jgi:hypothetical protein